MKPPSASRTPPAVAAERVMHSLVWRVSTAMSESASQVFMKPMRHPVFGALEAAS
jgi:hypothetical protein